MKKYFAQLSVVQWIVVGLSITINIFIIVSSCLPSGPSTSESGWVVNIVKSITNAIKPNTINENNIGIFSSFIRKFVGHFSLFFVSGILTTLSIKFLYYDKSQKFWFFVIISSISGLFLAVLTEFIQMFVDGRSGEITDSLIDFSGYLLALLAIGLIIYLKQRKNRKLEIEKNKE